MTAQPDRSDQERKPSPEETWCQVLESYGLDQEQAEALTRIVALRSEAWHAQCRALIRDPAARSILSPSPTDPDALWRGLELYRSKLAESERKRLRRPRPKGGDGGATPQLRVASP